MGIQLGSTVINCADLEAMTDFWFAALGLVPTTARPTTSSGCSVASTANLSLQLAKTPVSARDQMHLDLYSDDIGGRGRPTGRARRRVGA